MLCEMCSFESGHLATVDGDEMYCCDNCGAVMFVYDDRYYPDDTVPDITPPARQPDAPAAPTNEAQS